MMVAMQLHQRGAANRRQVAVVAFEKFSEERCLLGKLLRQFVVRKQTDQLVAEGADAGRLQPDNRRAGLNLRLQSLHRLAPQRLGLVDAAPIVERPTAAQRALRDRHLVTERLEQLGGCYGGLRPEIIVERVRPQHHALAIAACLAALTIPTAKGALGIRWDAALRSNAGNPFSQRG